MFKKISGLVLIALLAACASNQLAAESTAQPPSAPSAATQSPPAGDTNTVVNSTKYSTIDIVVTSAPGSDVDADDLDTVRKDLTDEVMSNLRVQSNLRAAAAGSKPDLLVNVDMKALHYVSVGKRVMLGLFAGHASMSMDLTLEYEKTDTTLWTQSVDTTSSLWSSYYGSSTVSQVNALADTITKAVKSKI